MFMRRGNIPRIHVESQIFSNSMHGVVVTEGGSCNLGIGEKRSRVALNRKEAYDPI